MEILIQLLLFLGIFLFVFLILRQLNLWYWKINTQINLLKEIRALLRYNLPSQVTEDIARYFSSEHSDLPKWSKEKDDKTASEVPEKLAKGEWRCRCGHINKSSSTECTKCGRSINAII
jgi:hypothetical protein